MEDYHRQLLQYTISIFDADGGLLRSVKNDSGQMDVLVQRGLDSDIVLSRRRVGEGIAGKVARDGYPIRFSGKATEDCMEEERRYPHLLIFPVSIQGKIHYVITLFKKGDKGFDENALSLASSISGLCSMLFNAFERINLLKGEVIPDSVMKEGFDIFSIREPEEIWRRFAEVSMKICNSGVSIVRIFNPEKDSFDIFQIKGIFDEDLMKRVLEVEERYFRNAISKGDPIIEREIHDDQKAGIPVRSLMIFPIKVKDYVYGTLSLINRISLCSIVPEPFSDYDFRCICNLKEYVAKAIEIALEIKKIKELVMIDEKTGLPNRKFFEARAVEEINRSARFFRRITVILMEVDIGERESALEFIRNIGRHLRKSIRSYDIISSMDEGKIVFLILEPLDGEMIIIERLKEMIKKKGWEFLGKEKDLFVRVGWASFPRDGSSINHLINSAFTRIREININY